MQSLLARHCPKQTSDSDLQLRREEAIMRGNYESSPAFFAVLMRQWQAVDTKEGEEGGRGSRDGKGEGEEAVYVEEEGRWG